MTQEHNRSYIRWCFSPAVWFQFCLSKSVNLITDRQSFYLRCTWSLVHWLVSQVFIDKYNCIIHIKVKIHAVLDDITLRCYHWTLRDSEMSFALLRGLRTLPSWDQSDEGLAYTTRCSGNVRVCLSLNWSSFTWSNWTDVSGAGEKLAECSQ